MSQEKFDYQLSEDQVDRWKRSTQSHYCPQCFSDDIASGAPIFTSVNMSQRLLCNNCKLHISIYYKVKTIYRAEYHLSRDAKGLIADENWIEREFVPSGGQKCPKCNGFAEFKLETLSFLKTQAVIVQKCCKCPAEWETVLEKDDIIAMGYDPRDDVKPSHDPKNILTEQQVETFVSNYGAHACPRCTGTEIDAAEPIVTGSNLTQECFCRTCNLTYRIDASLKGLFDNKVIYKSKEVEVFTNTEAIGLTKNSFLKQGGRHCPICNSSNISLASTPPATIGNRYFQQAYFCKRGTCGAKWDSVYKTSEVVATAEMQNTVAIKTQVDKVGPKTVKKQAKACRDFLKEKGHDVKLSDCQEMVAQSIHGSRNLRAMISQKAAPQPTMPELSGILLLGSEDGFNWVVPVGIPQGMSEAQAEEKSDLAIIEFTDADRLWCELGEEKGEPQPNLGTYLEKHGLIIFNTVVHGSQWD